MRFATKHFSAAALVAGAILTLLAGGCAATNILPIADEADFQRQVIEADKPVMVDFYKEGGCPTCKLLEPILDQLADEYRGRVTFVKFAVMTPFFQTTSEAIKQRYNIIGIPTAVLFVHGKEVKRWPLYYLFDDYRKTLDEVLGGPTPKAASAATGKPWGKS
jgi:thioredoxin 1